MEIEGSQEIDLDFEPHDLVGDNQFSEAMGAEEEVGISLGIDENGRLPELHDSTEPERNKRNGRYNLRKSLAWDSAFFTSAGVLDAEELSSMITGTEKSEKPSLPGIQEEITGSTESLSTLESDNLTLDGCEDDLFVDIRASIQRSSKKASNLINSSSKKAAMEVDSTAVSALKKEDMVSEDKNSKLGSKKTSGLPTGRISKPQPKQIPKPAPGKSIKQDSIRSQAASIAMAGETNSTLPKPPKSIPSSTAAAKRDSIGIARVKSEGGNSRFGATGTVSSKGTQPSKVPVLSGSRKPSPKPAVSSKSSLLSSSTTSSVQSLRSSTSSDSSVNTSSGIPAKPKPTLMTARRNVGKSGGNNTGPSGSIPKNPSRASPRNKLPASTLSSHLMSSKISSSVSPASSISEWSSASSSSSMANEKCNNSRASLDTSSCKSMDSDNILLDPRNRSAVPTADRPKNQGVNATRNTSKKSSTQAGTLQAPSKPSGLRMPSPKIGFFDGVKSPARTPNGPKQPESGLRTAFSKNGDSSTPVPIRSSNSKLKSAKIPTSRMMTHSSNIKSASPKAPLPVSFQGKPNASSISTDGNDSSIVSLGVRGSSTGETCQKQDKVEAEDGVKQLVDASRDAIDKENSDSSSIDKNVYPRNTKTLCDEDVLITQDCHKNNSDSHAIGKGYSDDLSVDKNVGPGDIKAVSDEDLLINQDHLKKHSDSHVTDKGNLDDSTADKNVGPGDIRIVDEVLINQDRLKKISDLHSFDQGGPGDIETVCDEDLLINQGDLKENSDSHATEEGYLDDLSVDKNVGTDDVKAVEKYFDSHATDGGNSDDSIVDKNLGPVDIKTVFDEEVLIRQDHLTKISNLHSFDKGDPGVSKTACEDVLITQGHLKENSDPNATDKGNMDDSSMDKIVGPSDSKSASDELINQDHLKKSSDSDAWGMDKNVGPGDMKAPPEDVLINQDQLKKSSDFHAIDEGNLDDSSMEKTVGPSDIKTVADEDALINQDHGIETGILDDSSMNKNVGPTDIKTVSDEEVVINLDLLKMNSDSHAIDSGNLDDLSMDENVGPGVIKTVADIEVLISQDHLKENSDSHAIDKGYIDDLSMDKNMGCGDIETLPDEDVLIHHDDLSIDEGNLDHSSVCKKMGPEDMKTVSDEDALHLKQCSDSHAIYTINIDESSENESPGEDMKTASDEDAMINQDHLKQCSDSHAIDTRNIDESSENVGPGEDVKTVSDEDALINQHHLKQNPPICEAFEKENDDKKGVYHNVNELTCELKVDSSECALSFPAIASEPAACRAPFSLKNTPDSYECIDTPKDLVAEKTGYVLSSSEQKENI